MSRPLPLAPLRSCPLLLLELVACGGSQLAVESYPQPPAAVATPVGYPPPPAQIEHLAATPPAPGCLWLDGRWAWVARGWDWIPGGWIRPPTGCRYSAPTITWATSGGRDLLYYRPGRWYAEGDARVCAEPVICPTSPAQFPSESSSDS